MKLLPQDAVVVLAVALHPEQSTLAQLAADLGLSGSQVHYAVERARVAGLLVQSVLRANVPNALEFLIHGLRYVFPAELGPIVRGVPTAHCAPVLREAVSPGEHLYVWPHPHGKHRGIEVKPLHKCVPAAALRDHALYDALACVEALRVGAARERKIAAHKLKELLEDAALQ